MQQKKRYTEEEVIQLLRTKSKEGYEALYGQYSAALYGVAVKITNSEEAAQDVLQDAIIKIWKGFDKFDAKKGKLFTWLLNVTRNTAIDYLRSKHVKYKIQNQDDDVSMANEPSVNVSYDHIGIKEALVNLKPEQKEVIDILYFGGYTQEEAAKELDLPLGTLKTRARAAIKGLKALLKDRV